MNFQKVLEWAEKIDIIQVENKGSQRDTAKCYKNMIIERIAMMNAFTKKTEGFYTDIEEAIKALEKVGVVLPVEPKEPIVEHKKPPVEHKKPSEVILDKQVSIKKDKSTLLPQGEHSTKRKQEPAKS